MKTLFLVLPLLLAPGVAMAQATSGLYNTCYAGKKLSAVALDGAAATRTFSLAEPSARPAPGSCEPRGYAGAVVTVKFTHTNNGTLTLTCTTSPDGGTTDAEPSHCASGAGR